jgi:RNA recognition motif-containing protein
MTIRLFIGNLSYKVSDSELTQFFSDENIPTDSIKIIRDAETGRSRGFAFAELPPETDLAAAIEKLSGKQIDGRTLTVSEARPQKKREFGGGGLAPRQDRPGGGRGDRKGNRPRGRFDDPY